MMQTTAIVAFIFILAVSNSVSDAQGKTIKLIKKETCIN